MSSMKYFQRAAIYSTRRVDRVFVTETVNSGLIPDPVKPKSMKTDSHNIALFDVQH